jgi:SanA protein
MRLALRLIGTSLFLAVLVLGAAAVWVRFSTAGYLYDDARAVPGRDVALVLGASVFRSGKPSPVVEGRLRAGRALLDAGKVTRILVSGDHQPDQYDEAESMRAWLLKEGVPEGKIVIDKAGLRTYDSVVRAAALFGAKSIVVCTQAFHLPRAVYLARRAGIDAVGLKAGGELSASGFYNLARESLATVRGVIDAQFLHPARATTTAAAQPAAARGATSAAAVPTPADTADAPRQASAGRNDAGAKR